MTKNSQNKNKTQTDMIDDIKAKQNTKNRKQAKQITQNTGDKDNRGHKICKTEKQLERERRR